MNWFFKIREGCFTIKKWWVIHSRQGDPNILPYRARRCAAFHIEVIAVILGLNVAILHKLAGIGLVLGVFGAGVLWWETNVNDHDLQSVRNEMKRSVSIGPRSYFDDLRNLTIWYMAGLMPLFLLSGTLILIWKKNSSPFIFRSPLVGILYYLRFMPLDHLFSMF